MHSRQDRVILQWNTVKNEWLWLPFSGVNQGSKIRPGVTVTPLVFIGVTVTTLVVVVTPTIK